MGLRLELLYLFHDQLIIILCASERAIVLVGLIVGPLFVVAGWGFALGLRHEVRDAIERRSGPVRLRGHGAAA
jgi:hypothetical protein